MNPGVSAAAAHPDPANARSQPPAESGSTAARPASSPRSSRRAVQKQKRPAGCRACRSRGTPNSSPKAHHTPRVVMMLVERRCRRQSPLRVALVTTHLPLRDVPAAITHAAVSRKQTLAIVLRRPHRAAFAIASPRICAVCGLNPHAAAKSGHLGREEPRRDRALPSPTPRAHPVDVGRPRCRRIRFSSPKSPDASTRSSRCTTTRGCRCSRRRASVAVST